jgi:hypothetical protein
VSPRPASMREDRGRVRIPADVERPDKLLSGLTARQLAILGVAAVVLWGAYAGTRHVVPTAVFAVVAIPVAAAATMLALGRFEGVAADRWVSAAWRHHRSPRRLVPAAPAFLAADAGPPPGPLRLPFAGIGDDGIVDLGADGAALVCRASAVTFRLRTPAEQEALVAGFARWLNGLDQPAQLLVRAEPVDLTPTIDALLDAAPGLPHPALEAAARDHAEFLASLAARRDLLRREVLVVLRPGAPTGRAGAETAARLHRRAAEAAAALAAAGVTLSVLDATAAATCGARALDPAGDLRPGTCGPVLSGIDVPVTVARTRGDRR